MYLVDGNNVMGQRVGWHRDKPGAQRRLIRDLVRFVKQEGGPVTVVFDGSPLTETTDGQALDGIQIFYARPGRDADDRIVELAGEIDDTGSILAVTSDRGLRTRLQELGVGTLRSGEFQKLLGCKRSV